jgi:type II secretory pathway pseudopilin PulG
MANASREDGFTIIEVLVASLIMVLGVLATFQVLNAATTNTTRAKDTQVVLNIAQQEMEKLRSLTWAQLALTTAPGFSSSPNNPLNRVDAADGTFALSANPNANYASLVRNGGSLTGGGTISGGTVNPGPESFTEGDLSGRIYRFIVWRNDPSCPSSHCIGIQDYKRIVVAVDINSTGQLVRDRRYVEIASDFIDPNDSPTTEPTPGANGVVTAQQFFLSDTPCDAAGNTVRQDITGEHLLHNTLGTCASGVQTGVTPGAPDALVTGFPPDPDPLDLLNPLTYDYSNDFYLEPTPDYDKGVQIRRQDTSGCSYTPSGSNPESMIHRWVTDPLAANFAMTGTLTLEFYTRTINSSSHTGRMCVYLFNRSEAGAPPVATDTRYVNKGVGTFGYNIASGFFGYQPGGSGLWPGICTGVVVNGWTRCRLAMRIDPATIPAGQRLGVAISVDRGLTPADALPFLYDHPDYPSRLEIDTNTPLDVG